MKQQLLVKRYFEYVLLLLFPPERKGREREHDARDRGHDNQVEPERELRDEGGVGVQSWKRPRIRKIIVHQSIA